MCPDKLQHGEFHNIHFTLDDWGASYCNADLLMRKGFKRLTKVKGAPEITLDFRFRGTPSEVDIFSILDGHSRFTSGYMGAWFPGNNIVFFFAVSLTVFSTNPHYF